MPEKQVFFCFFTFLDYICIGLKILTMATTTQKREINWLFPEPGTIITNEEYRERIREAENSGTMTHYEFIKKMNEWFK
ncbi:hypothetical protein FACS189421_08140 [Bacteroidia bacterium]|nr:hypothetical protein FACS189421_08140 [Bacteroidia bacterium]GHT03839.1 hypothetical protein FACS189423_05610 [Bacteroidia bacterium]GHT49836.1 hypothetical protein FACS189440_16230 [Bacteroidia bacterium]